MARSSVRDLTGRIDLRRRMSRRRRLLTIVGVVLALVAAGTAVWVVRYSQVFVADQTRVTGLSLLKEADVLSAARVPQGRPLAQIADLPKTQVEHEVRPGKTPNPLIISRLSVARS